MPRARGLLGLVERAVVEHHHLGAGGDEEAALGLDAGRAELLDLADQVERVHDHAVADDARLRRMEDAARHEPQHALLPFGDHGVARVRPALVADDDVGLVGQHVYDLPLALVAPLRPDKNRIHLACTP